MAVAFKLAEKTMTVKLIVAAFFLVALPFSEAKAQDGVDCWYRDKDREGSYIHSDYCGLVRESEIVYLAPEWMENVYFDLHGLSCVKFGRELWFWVRRDGTSMRVPMWDNGCAYFQEGLTVAEVGDRQVYIDKSLQIILDPGFASLGPFEEGYAKVCNGPFEYEENGEHSRRTGGACGRIGGSGRLVMEPVYPAEEYVAFRDFRNANNHCPAPPIDDAPAALCHALRHAMSQDWTGHSVEKVNDRWEVVYSFMNRGRERTNSIELGIERANVHWHG